MAADTTRTMAARNFPQTRSPRFRRYHLEPENVSPGMRGTETARIIQEIDHGQQ